MDIDVIYNENCIEVLKRLGDNSIDAIVTDPPYNLVSINKRFKSPHSRNTPAMNTKEGGVWARKAKGFMGKEWDGTGIAFNLELWTECLRVIKPGGNLLSFGGTRTYHRMVCAIEDAGFEIRDCIMWVYGSGFPKSLNIGKAVDKLQGNERENLGYKQLNPRDKRVYVPKSESAFTTGQKSKGIEAQKITKGTSEWEGYGTGLKPAYEPIILAMKPLDGTFAENCLKWGVGGLNIDATRIPYEADALPSVGGRHNIKGRRIGAGDTEYGFKSLEDAQVNTKGRFPANLIHDGSQEVMELFPNSKSPKPYKGEDYKDTSIFGIGGVNHDREFGDNGSAARFFYCAKASKRERNMGCEELPRQGGKAGELTARGNTNPVCQNCGGSKIDRGNGMCQCEFPEWRAVNKPQQNNHPTVKPLALMEYLVKLVTRPGHIVLDPFIGSGTTAIAAINTNRHYLGCELDKNYYDICIKRIEGYKQR